MLMGTHKNKAIPVKY